MRRIGQGLRDWYLTHGADGVVREVAATMVAAAVLVGMLRVFSGDRPGGGVTMGAGFLLLLVALLSRIRR